MLRNYVLVTVRNLMRNKLYAAISVLGLAAGLACCIFIMLWVHDELSYDAFHANVKNLYRVEMDQYRGDNPFHVYVTPYPMAAALVAEIPEIADASRFSRMGSVLVKSANGESYYERGMAYVDPAFLRMFSFPLIKGDAQRALGSSNSIVISEALAAKYFGTDDPLGKSLRISLSGETASDFQVTGVLGKTPRNTTLTFEALLPFEILRKLGVANDSWRSNEVIAYVQLGEGASVRAVNEKITSLVLRHQPQETPSAGTGTEPQPQRRRSVEFSLLAVKDVHLKGHFGYETSSNATQKIWLLCALALFVLLIACINFMNLATARAEKRAREVGMRKLAGATRRQIAWQFYGESTIYAILGLFTAVLVVESLLPAFNSLTGKEMSLNLTGNGDLLLGLLAISLFSGAVAGSYPAMFMSSLQPIKMLGRSSTRQGRGATFRKVLVITQFAMSICVIVATMVVARQTAYMKETNLGYNRDNLMWVTVRGKAFDSYAALKTELLKDPRILGVSGSSQNPTFMSSNAGGAQWEGKPPEFNPLITVNDVDCDFVETMGIEMLEGRSFSRAHLADTLDGCLINEELAKLIGKESVVGKRFNFATDGKIIGVMKNFNYQPLTYKIEPLALYLTPREIAGLLIRPRPEDISSSVDFIKKSWERMFPQYPFTYRFLDEDFDRIYREEQQIGTLMKYFSALCIVIACLGLYGLAAFVSETRTKEIGIRKSLGATVAGIVGLLSKEFLALVAVAFLIAVPLAWYGCNRWLQNFAYRVDVGWSTYFLAGAIALVIAFMAVGYHAIRAAQASPVKSLKYE